VERTVAEFGGIDVVVKQCRQTRWPNVAEMTPEALTKSYEVNCTARYPGWQKALPPPEEERGTRPV